MNPLLFLKFEVYGKALLTKGLSFVLWCCLQLTIWSVIKGCFFLLEIQVHMNSINFSWNVLFMWCALYCILFQGISTKDNTVVVYIKSCSMCYKKKTVCRRVQKNSTEFWQDSRKCPQVLAKSKKSGKWWQWWRGWWQRWQRWRWW